MRLAKIVIPVGLALVVLGLLILWPAPNEQSEPVDFRARSFDGEQARSTRELRGRPALLTSWATWCTECRYELPQLERLWREQRDQGLQVVAVNVDTTGGVGPPGRAADAYGLTMPLWSDESNSFTSFFGGIGVPTSVLLDERGRIVHVWKGAVDFEDPSQTSPITSLLQAAGGRAPPGQDPGGT